MKRGWTLLAIGLILTAQASIARAAPAEEIVAAPSGASAPASSGRIAARDRGARPPMQEYTFDGAEIDGSYLSPEIGSVETVRRSAHSLMPDRVDFRDRLVESVNDL